MVTLALVYWRRRDSGAKLRKLGDGAYGVTADAPRDDRVESPASGVRLA